MNHFILSFLFCILIQSPSFAQYYIDCKEINDYLFDFDKKKMGFIGEEISKDNFYTNYESKTLFENVVSGSTMVNQNTGNINTIRQDYAVKVSEEDADRVYDILMYQFYNCYPNALTFENVDSRSMLHTESDGTEIRLIKNYQGRTADKVELFSVYLMISFN